MKNHKQIAVDSNFVINNYKNYATERKQALFKLKPGSEQKVTAQSPAANGYFSQEIAIDGNYAVLGTQKADVNAGEADIYQKINGTWTYKQTLEAADRQADDKFGSSVAISGTTIVIGAEDDNSDQGSAYVFDLQSNGSWTQTAKLTASDGAANEEFGSSVAIDGDVLVVGAEADNAGVHNLAGSAYVFTRSAGSWSQTVKLQAPDPQPSDQFGQSVGISGDTIIVGAPFEDTIANDSGAVYIFRLSGGSWSFLQKIQAYDRGANEYFGFSISISGDTVIVGAPFDDDEGSDSGSAYVFRRVVDGTYTQVQKLTASDGAASDFFGEKVSISGDIAVISSNGDDDKGSGSGSAYIFQKTADNVWRQRDKATASDGVASDSFGSAVAVSGTSIVVNAYLEHAGDTNNAGSTYFYEIEPSEEFATRTPILQPPFSLLTPGVHSLRTK